MAWKPRPQQSSSKYPEKPEKKQNIQNNQRQNFWVTCKTCQTKFSVPQEWIFKYLERIGYDAPDEE